MKYVLANPKKYGLHKAVKISDANVGISAELKIPVKIPVVDYIKLKLTDQ